MLDINENSVSAVLLNDGWHQPIAAGTFKIDNIWIHAEAAAGVDFGTSCAMWDEHYSHSHRASHINSGLPAKETSLGRWAC